MIRKRRKALAQATNVPLMRIQGELLEQFPEMTPYEVAQAINARAQAALHEEWNRVYQAKLEMDAKRLEQVRQAEKPDDDLKLQMIDAGFRAMAMKNHPDTGGSDEAMIRLNRARDRLKAGV